MYVANALTVGLASNTGLPLYVGYVDVPTIDGSDHWLLLSG
jgi:hypothetical protein